MLLHPPPGGRCYQWRSLTCVKGSISGASLLHRAGCNRTPGPAPNSCPYKHTSKHSTQLSTTQASSLAGPFYLAHQPFIRPAGPFYLAHQPFLFLLTCSFVAFSFAALSFAACSFAARSFALVFAFNFVHFFPFALFCVPRTC